MGGMCGVQSWSSIRFLIQSASYPLSAITSAPTGRSLSSSSAIGASFIWPGDSSISTGRPLPITRRCSLVVSPPRLRPIQASPVCFFGRQAVPLRASSQCARTSLAIAVFTTWRDAPAIAGSSRRIAGFAQSWRRRRRALGFRSHAEANAGAGEEGRAIACKPRGRHGRTGTCTLLRRTSGNSAGRASNCS